MWITRWITRATGLTQSVERRGQTNAACCVLLLGVVCLSLALAGDMNTVAREEESAVPYDPGSGLDVRPDTTRYHSYARMRGEIDSLLLRYPTLVKLETLATTTTGGRLVLAVKVTSNARTRADKPAVLFDGAHHGCEFIGPEICLQFMSSLLSNYPQPGVRKLVDSLNIYIVPMLDPDGHEVNFSGGDTWWRKNTRDNNGNRRFDKSDGVELNRNYPFNWSLGGSSVPSDREYRGPSAGSEAEVQGLMRLTTRERFLLGVCYHSSQDAAETELLYYPWFWDGVLAPDYTFIQPVADSLARSLKRYDGGGVFGKYLGYATSGGMYRNWSYSNYGVFSFTIETGHTYYPNSKVDSLCKLHLPGAYYLLRRALGTGLTGRVTDSTSGLPLAAQVVLVGVDSSSAHPIAARRADSTYGRFRRLLNPGSYTIRVSCSGYRTKTVGPIAVSAGPPAVVNVALSRAALGGSQAEPGTVAGSSSTPRVTLTAVPNPFTDVTLVSYSIAEPGNASLRLYDVSGKSVRTLFAGYTRAGHYSTTLRSSQVARAVAQGVYLLKLETGCGCTTQKLVIR